MIADPTALVALASAAVVAFSVASAAALKGWRGWLELKRLEVTGGSRLTLPATEVSELKARVRRLEAIASGIDL